MSEKVKEKTNMKEAMATYFKGVKAEWGKISWPQKPQIIGETITVFIVTIVFTVIVFLLDTAFKWLLHLIPQ